MLCQIIFSLVTDSERCWIRPWTWNLGLRLFRRIELGTNYKAILIKHCRKHVGSRAGIFIFLVALKWTSNFHFLPALSEAESFFNIFSKIVFQSVGIGRRRTGCIFGKVVLLAKSKAGGSEAAFAFNIVKFVASTQCNETCT